MRKNFMKAQNLWTTTAMLAVMGAMPSVHAQETSALQLEEIVVTSAKREQSLQDVPMAVTAFGGAQLEKMGATGFLDYATKVPNLGFGADADGRFDSRKTGIRGVFGAGQATTGGTTGFYIDDMPIPETMNPRVTDVERIEVLRGPQGTLYGARSMGGTIRLISKQPSLTETEVRGHALVANVKEGNFNWAVDAAVSVPVVEDKLGLRIMAYYGEDSGVQDRLVMPGSPGPDFFEKNVDDETFYGGQIAATIALTEDLTFVPKFIYQKVKAGGLPFADNQPGNFVQLRNFNLAEDGRDEFYIASGTLNWQKDFGTFVSSTGYMKREVFENEDETYVLTYFFGTPPIPSTISQDISFDAFVHETRFASDFDGPFQMNAGIFYQETNENVIFPPAMAIGLDEAFSDLIGAPYPPGVLGTDMIYTTDGHFDTKEKAAFFELSYEVTEWLKATFGGRYFNSKTDYFVTRDGIANGGFTMTTGQQKENGFNPKLLLEARVSEDVNVYTTASKGFRIGGVNGSIPADLCADDLIELGNPDPDSLGSFDSDSLWNYEVGVKSALLDRKVTLNAAAFYINWKNVIQRVQPSCGFAFLTNVGDATNKGVEIELSTRLVQGLDVSFGLGYTHAEFTKITNPFSPVQEGDRVQQVPKWTFTTSGQYSFPLTGELEGFIRADYSYQSNSLSGNNSIGTPRIRPSWSLVNVRAGIYRNVWELAAFVDNLTNEHINLADNKSLAAEHPARPRIVTNRPRTIGVEARVNF